MPKASQEGVMSLGEVMFWAKCIQILDKLVLEKYKSILELAMLV